MTPPSGSRGTDRRTTWALRVAALVAGSVTWLAVVFVGRARWFDLRCLRLNETSVSMTWVGWFPPHFQCLDDYGRVVARDYSETLWLLLMLAPVAAIAAVLLWSWHRSRAGT